MRELVLVGLGHAHRYLLAHRDALAGVFRLTVVAPHSGRYGGATAAMLAGQLSAESLRWRVPRDVRVIAGRAVGCQPVHRRLWLADGCSLSYDRLSLAFGTSRLPAWAGRPGVREPRVWSGHSVQQLIALRQAIDHDECARLVVAGGSPQSLEITGGLSGRAVTLLWPEHGGGRRTRAALRRLAWCGVDVVPSTEAAALGAGCVRCTDGRRFPAAHVVWAGPARPGVSALAMGLPVADSGLRVDRRLQSVKYPTVNVLGALASLDGRHVLPGWDAERQARVVFSQLRAETGVHALARYKPSRADMPLDLGPEAGVVSGARLSEARARRKRQRTRQAWLES